MPRHSNPKGLNALKNIVAEAKRIRKSHPFKPWKTCIKVWWRGQFLKKNFNLTTVQQLLLFSEPKYISILFDLSGMYGNNFNLNWEQLGETSFKQVKFCTPFSKFTILYKITSFDTKRIENKFGEFSEWSEID